MTRDSKLIELSCKEVLMTIVKESKVLDKKLSFFQKTLLYDKIREMDYDKVISLLFNEGEKITTEQKRDFESKTKKIATYGAAGIGGAMLYRRRKNLKNLPGKIKRGAKWMFQAPGELKSFRLQKAGTRAGIVGAAGAVAGLYLFRKLTDPCIRKHIGNKQAQLACKMEASKKVISQIKTDIGKCTSASNPVKCKQKLSKELIKWQSKYQSYLVELSKAKRQ